MATCPDERFRDGVKAVQFAQRACTLTKWNVIDYLDTLAAAYAEAGDFNHAIGLQQTVCEDPADKADQADFESRLELYLDGKPFHRGTPDEKREAA
jgi:hypothetical protein